ncbi:MAG: carboxypeptidase regulatory-like domain-containing protein [Actinomycetota bacterium]|nr:carboxypeptidase regulatory-like domain-containing protein [Actinomycetota bacterium]
MRNVRHAFVLAACLSAASWTGASSSQAVGVAAPQGIYGTVTLASPLTVCEPEEPECTRALVGVRVVVLRDGEVVASARTGREGGYRLALPAGRYSVTLRRERAAVRKRPDGRSRVPTRPERPTAVGTRLGVLARRGVTVAEGEFRRVDFRLTVRRR